MAAPRWRRGDDFELNASLLTAVDSLQSSKEKPSKLPASKHYVVVGYGLASCVDDPESSEFRASLYVEKFAYFGSHCVAAAWI